MRAFNDMNCKLCDRKIKEGDLIATLNSFGKYIDICNLCDRKLYQKYSEVIIQKIKE